jgi:HEAT repeat protein
MVERKNADTIETLISDLLNGEDATQNRAANELVSMGARVVQPLLAAIVNDDHSEDASHLEHRILRDVLVRIGEPAFQAVVDTLNPTGVVRRAAVKTAVLFHDVRAVDPLIKVALSKRCGQLARLYAIDALGYFKDPRAFEPLITLLSDEEVIIRGTAARALAEYRDQRAVEPIRLALNHTGTSEWMDWRTTATEALKTIQNPYYKPRDRGFFINYRYA